MTVFCEAVEYCKRSPSVSILVGFGATYAAYYILYVVRKPFIACRDDRLRKFLQRYCPAVNSKFWPTFWCFESRAQTVLRALWKKRPKFTYQHEMLTTPDGGEIKLDWFHNEENSRWEANVRPTVLLLPGLTGSSGESYILSAVHEATTAGYRTVVFNNRGMGGATLKTPRTYCASNTEDMSLVVQRIKGQFPEAPLFAAGFSLGGMILFNYLAKTGKECGILGGMVASVPWDVFESSKVLEQPINRFLYNQPLARNLCAAVRRNIELFEQHFDMDHVLQSATIREFDERFTTKMFGYQTCDDYYKESNLHYKIHHIEVPLICINAADDAFSPYHTIPLKDADDSHNVAIIVTSHGGHIGFLEGLNPFTNPTFLDKMFRQFSRAIFENGQELQSS
ncbi:phospholipase ABHD3-like [Liolophura sinensis]|uniref:phospholipase ABHD3-like n=1 Tax=Liolophura sinensis TaxID=3198878 RepID=UPI0031591867